MSTVKISDSLQKEVVPILEDLGLSLEEAINIYLHQIKIHNGIPFELKRKSILDKHDFNLSDFKKIKFKAKK